MVPTAERKTAPNARGDARRGRQPWRLTPRLASCPGSRESVPEASVLFLKSHAEAPKPEMGTPPEVPAEAPKAEMGTPPEVPAEAPKPEMKKVRRAAKKVARKVRPKNKFGKKVKKSAKKFPKKAPKKAKAKKKKAKKAKR